MWTCPPILPAPVARVTTSSPCQASQENPTSIFVFRMSGGACRVMVQLTNGRDYEATATFEEGACGCILTGAVSPLTAADPEDRTLGGDHGAGTIHATSRLEKGSFLRTPLLMKEIPAHGKWPPRFRTCLSRSRPHLAPWPASGQSRRCAAAGLWVLWEPWCWLWQGVPGDVQTCPLRPYGGREVLAARRISMPLAALRPRAAAAAAPAARPAAGASGAPLRRRPARIALRWRCRSTATRR